MKVKEREFIKRMYPVDYIQQKDYSEILRYQYNMTITKDELLDLELGQRDAFSKIYNFLRQKAAFDENTELTLTKLWENNDIIYLMIKEHLLEYYEACLNNSNATIRQTYNKKRLNEAYNSTHPSNPWRIQENYRIYSELPHIRHLNASDMIILLESRTPYSAIPYQLLHDANINPVFCCMHNGADKFEKKTLEKKLTSYILAQGFDSSSEISYDERIFYIIGEKPFFKEDINRIFSNAYEYLYQLNGTEFLNSHAWADFSSSDEHITLTFLIVFFEELYDHYASSQKEPLWNELPARKKDDCKNTLKTLFNYYYETQRQKQKSSPSYTIKFADYKKYLMSYCNLYKKTFSSQSKIPEYRLHSLTSYWISETVFPTLTIRNLIGTAAFKNLLEKIQSTYSGTGYKRYLQRLENECLDSIAHLLNKLSLCPNIFNQITLLEYFSEKYEPYSDFNKWYNEFNSTLDYYNSVYYPLLEASFHWAYSLYQASDNSSKPDNIQCILPLYFDRKYAEILKQMNSIVEKKDSQTHGEIYVTEKFYSAYMDSYEVSKDRLYQRLNKFDR